MDILESYLFFVRQKNIIEDKDDAIAQLTGAVDEKINEPGDSEEIRVQLVECRKRWNELGKKCR
jgi:hypothetical protein